MRKIIFIFLFLYSIIFIDNVFADDLYYENSSRKIYLKSDLDSSTGTLINDFVSNNFIVSPDGAYLYYLSKTDYKIYKKSISDSGSGIIIVNNPQTSRAGSFCLSPDGAYIVYSNSGDGYKLYKKSSSDNSIGSAINSNNNSSYPSYSPDGSYIIYNIYSSGYLYKKSSSDTSNGSIIATSVSRFPIYSPDGAYIYYINNTNSHLYKKSSSDTSNGSDITYQPVMDYKFTVSPDGAYIVYSYTPGILYKKSSSDKSNGSVIQNGFTALYFKKKYSCSDGIQNQDETGIDVGGICGINTFDYNGDFFKGDNIQCSTKQYNDPAGSVTRFTDFGDMTPTPFGDGSGETVGGVINNFFNIYGDIGYDDCTDNCLNKDAFRGVFFNYGSYLPHEVMKYNTSSIANVEYFPTRTDPLSDKDPRIRIFRKRNGAYSSFNTIQCSGTGGTTGCDFATLGDITKGAFIEKVSKYDFQPCATDIIGGNTCTILFNIDGQYADLHIKSGFTGLRFGTATNDKINKIECKNDSYGCQWINTGTGFFCSGVTKYDPEIGFIDGQCDISPEGYCGPVEDFRAPGFNEHAILDGSGNVVGIAPGYTDNVDLNKDILDDIFSCPDYESWIDTPSCILQITKNIYTNFKKGINNLRKGPHSMINTVEKIGSGTSQRQFSQVNPQGVNMVDTVFRGAWNSSLDKNQSLNQWSRAAFYMSILLALLAVVLTILLIRKNKG